MKLTPTLAAFGAALCLSTASAKTKPENTVLFYGNSMVERLLEGGDLEAYLQLARKEEKQPPYAIRSLAWTGDEVGYRLRPEGYVRHLTKVLAEWEANTIVLGFGMNEAFNGEEGLEDFKTNYASYLDQLAEIHPKASFVLLSPTAVESEQYPTLGKIGEAAKAAEANGTVLNSTILNQNLELYTAAIRELAAARKAKFVDAYSASQQAYQDSESPLTSNGIHLNEAGNAIVAKAIASQILSEKMPKVDTFSFEQLAQAASLKQGYVAEIARPKNSVVYFGVRQRPEEYQAEMPRYHQLVEMSDKLIAKLLKDPKLSFDAVKKPSIAPMAPIKGKDAKRGNGIIKPPAEAMAEFTVAKGYEVNLFASEEEFPVLRNPVQIAFDAKGRLWVVTMPSFPHTVPGRPKEDKIIILEDTDKDGKADKSTVFAKGFDALDGITFHHMGPIISAQPRHLLANDSDGDDVADSLTEVLRGIDMTDSHHGGMIAADPYGGIVHSDGVFLRSQLETPYGPVRSIDATTFRHDLLTKELRVEWQAATPNPWEPTFDKWGNNYQMYGDGLVIDGLVMTWTPLGVYHPFRHGTILGYGKGSAAAIISSENFPAEFQQGVASAALLGSYTVSLTPTSFNEGKIKAGKRLDLVKSLNPAFRPAALAFGMDGALYISDFCSSIIGHAQHPMRDPGWDSKHGRIWRVVRKGAPVQTTFPKIAGATPAELVKLLDHPEDLVRSHVRMELCKNGEQGIAAAKEWLGKQDKKAATYEQSVLEVIFASEALNITQPDLLDILLASKDPLYRGAAIHTVRLQANRLENPKELIEPFLNDSHPRVQMEVVDAIAHMQKEIPDVIELAKLVKSKNKTVLRMIDDLKAGTESHKQRSIPVLSVSKKAQVSFWKLKDLKKPDEAGAVFEYTRKKTFTPAIYQTYIRSKEEQPAILGMMCNYINIDVNGVRLLSDNERWSKDQQVSFVLNKGINIITLEIPEQGGGGGRVVSVYDLMGQPIQGADFAKDEKQLLNLEKEYLAGQQQFAGAIKIQAVPHQLKFAPTEVRVKAGSDVRLIIGNPDAMIHNFVIVKPGALNQVGEMADKLAADPKGMELAYVPDAPEVLYHTTLLNPETNQELKFKAPTTPGSYPFLCTLPGHWRVMQGVMIVE